MESGPSADNGRSRKISESSIDSSLLSSESSYKHYSDRFWLSNLSYLLLIAIWGCSYFIILPISFNLVIITTLILYVGCHQSLRLLDHNVTPLDEKETISENDAYKVPILASISLGLLYLAFKYLDKETINYILSIYFCLIGTFSLTVTFAPLLSFLFPLNRRRYEFQFGINFTISELFAFIISMIVIGFYFSTKHYMLNNLLGISFCIQALERVSIGSYKIGCIILIGLFFYDIFWVFGTEVMVTVAKSFDAPIKLLFPKVFPCSEFPNGKFSLLGLGDIVVPGIFLSLLLRYDAVRSHVNPVGAETKAFPKPYFHVTLLSYSLGILLTVFVMYFFNSAQPALLYLVPACLLSTLVVGYWKQDMTHLWAYDEAKIYEEAKKLLKDGQDIGNGDSTNIDNEQVLVDEDKKER